MYQKVAKDIQQGKWSPLYVLYGTETYLIEEMVRHMKINALSGNADDFNYAVFDLEQVPVESMLQEAETLPFMGDRRLVIGQNAWFLTGAKAKKEVSHNLDALAAYTESPSDSSVVVLTVLHSKLDERKKLVKQLKKCGTVMNFKGLGTAQLRAWIKRKVSQYGAMIDSAAVEKLVQQTGNDLRLIHQECVKLATYVGEGGTITIQHVGVMVPRALEEDIFKLVDYMGKMKIEGALGVFYDLIKKREEPLKILSLIARQFRIMLQVKEMSLRGYSQKQTASALGLHPYAVKIAAEQGKQFSDKQLGALLLEAKKTDYAIKSGQKDKTLAIEWYLLRTVDIAGATS